MNRCMHGVDMLSDHLCPDCMQDSTMLSDAPERRLACSIQPEYVDGLSLRGPVRIFARRVASGRVSLVQNEQEALLTKDGAMALAHMLMTEAEK